MRPGNQGRDGDGDPDELGAALDHLDQVTVRRCSDGSGLLGDQRTEVAGVVVEPEHRHESIDGVDVGPSAHSPSASEVPIPWRTLLVT